ncbi:hypothetical protein JIN85_19855 [Luteolibacter pohnpeiensis]|uniref:Uncharacterized protein n=1 Tax=Luteolibacter pohnpeiensis TaxID=454153 RepID=A0A934VST8_9BACT|nr:hypothetical protein [Luteolibacter pohnpeiensis]MBK1884676.1 hypothetical protein [Luteolibacter pohnpeiensis]
MNTKWNPDQYFEKASLYLQRSARPDIESSERAFWSALALEQLCRASLCAISPTLNADPQDEGASILFALGYKGKKAPKTLPMHAVTARLELVLEKFTKDSRQFCEGFMFKRNEEVHDSTLAFEDLAEASWLTPFYVVCEVLCEAVSKDLADLLGKETSDTAAKLITAHKEDVFGKVKEHIKNHRAVYYAKDPGEQKKLSSKLPLIHSDEYGNTKRVKCPACENTALLVGTLSAESEPFLRDSRMYVKRTYQSTSYICGACGLKFTSVSELMAANFDPTFSEEFEIDLHDILQMDYEEDYMNM